MRQHTIRKSVSIEGVGLHWNQGHPGHGLSSTGRRRCRVRGSFDGRADPRAAGERRQLALRDDPRSERDPHSDGRAPDGRGGRARHDNVEIEVDGARSPRSTSAKPFVALFAFAGRLQQSARRRPLTLPCPLRVGSGGRWIHLFPRRRSGSPTPWTTTTRRSGPRSSPGHRPSDRSSRSSLRRGRTASCATSG